MYMKKKSLIDKKGSYIIESALCLPFYVIAILFMASIIIKYSTVENITFSLGDELRLAAMEAKVVRINPLVPMKIKERILDENNNLDDVKIYKYGYYEKYKGINDIIILNLKAEFENDYNLFFNNLNLDMKVMTRCFIGDRRNLNPLGIEEITSDESEVVYIFPNYGNCYHNESCDLIKNGCISVILTDYLIKNYKPCDLCKSKNAQKGEQVYVFPNSGMKYHLSNCKLIERDYIKIDKKIAIERGYVPCKKCGG